MKFIQFCRILLSHVLLLLVEWFSKADFQMILLKVPIKFTEDCSSWPNWQYQALVKVMACHQPLSKPMMRQFTISAPFGLNELLLGVYVVHIIACGNERFLLSGNKKAIRSLIWWIYVSNRFTKAEPVVKYPCLQTLRHSVKKHNTSILCHNSFY